VRVYLPLLLSFGVVDVADEEELVSAGGVALDDVDGVLDALEDELDGGVVLGDIDEELDIEPLGVEGVVDDDDEVPGDGVTTGGVFGVVVDAVSRLQPAMPTASPAQSSVISVLFIAISRWLRTGCPSPI
jgi:hypothetical protein